MTQFQKTELRNAFYVALCYGADGYPEEECTSCRCRWSRSADICRSFSWPCCIVTMLLLFWRPACSERISDDPNKEREPLTNQRLAVQHAVVGGQVCSAVHITRRNI